MRWIFLLLPALLFADVRESFELGARLLYWKPIWANEHYANDTDTGTRRILKPQYDWGFQADARWTVPRAQFFTALNLIGIDFKSSDQVSGALVPIPSDGLITTNSTSRIANQITYAGGDLEAGLRMLERACLRLDLSAGIRYAYLRERRTNTIDSIAPTGTDDRFGRSHYKGAGPRLQMSFIYEEILPGLTFTGKAATSLLAGRRRHDAGHADTAGEDSANVSRLRDTGLIPNIDFRLFFAYSVASPCACLTGEIGYEMRQFFHPLWRPNPLLLNAQSASFPSTQRLGFSGPYAAIRASF
jgi:Legionella pneumophila major outer membrane protein precursor